MTTLTDEMLDKANRAYFDCRGNDVEKLRAAIESILPDITEQARLKGIEEGSYRATERYLARSSDITRAARAEGCREAAACGGDTADAMVSEILARATAIEKGEE